MKQVSIILPVYNEEASISRVLDRLLSSLKSHNLDYEIVVVDDGSVDRTAEIVRQYDVQFIQHQRNKGYGVALKTGINNSKYNLIAMCDADGTYPIERIPEMVSLMDDYDMVVGARTGKNVNIPLVRRPAKWILNKYANYLVKDDIPDLNSGLRVFRKNVFEKFQGILPAGFSFTTTITLALLSNDYRVKYLSIDYFERGGKSKIRPIRDTLNFFSLVTRTSLYFNPLRVFIPIAVILLGLGVIFLAHDVFVIQNVTDKTMMVFLWGMQFGAIGLLADMISKLRS